MSTFDKNSQRNFAYLNSREFNLQQKYPFGLGFGGDGKDQFRIWIDENLKADDTCYINNHVDQTYEMGFILEPHIKNLNVEKKNTIYSAHLT